MSVLSQFRWNTTRAIAIRAALRGIGSSINFSLIALTANHLRNQRFGQAIEEVDSHYKHNVDQRNEIDLEVEGNEFEAQVRGEQGYSVQLPPLELAARLKLIRDACEAELSPHAGLRWDPIAKVRFPAPFDIVSPIPEAYAFMLAQTARISEAQVKNTMLALRVDEATIRQVLEQDHERGRKFLKDNGKELFSIIDSLEAKGLDGHALGIQDDELVEERLPALNRARLYVSADNGLVGRRAADLKSYIRSSGANPDTLGNIGLIDGERKLLRLKFQSFMKDPAIKDEIADAVSRGAKPPHMQALFPDILVAQAA